MNLTKPNYQAWLVEAADFPKNGAFKEKVEFLLRYAILAPSAHNTQPWAFLVRESGVKVYIDKKRRLSHSDPEQRQTYESLGACIENLVIAAEHFGFSAAVEYALANIEEDSDKKLVANVNLAPSAGSRRQHDDLFDAITKRHSAKLEYVSDKIPESLLSELKTFWYAKDKIGRLKDLNDVL
ncbi:MAG: hypothetical protein Q7R92_01905 [bacterium]|nr:hypothetical protein [bacterium]